MAHKDEQNGGAWVAIIAVAFLVLLLALYGCTQQQRQAGKALIDEHPTQAVDATYQQARIQVEAVLGLVQRHFEELTEADQQAIAKAGETVIDVEARADALLARGTLPTAGEIQPLLDAGMDAYSDVSGMTVRNAGLWTPEEHETFAAAQGHLKTLEQNVQALIAAGKLRDAGVALAQGLEGGGRDCIVTAAVLLLVCLRYSYIPDPVFLQSPAQVWTSFHGPGYSPYYLASSIASSGIS